jgi:K+-transporting ATPase KdpF subunit
MSADQAIGAAIAALLLAYLVYAMLVPEKF